MVPFIPIMIGAGLMYGTDKVLSRPKVKAWIESKSSWLTKRTDAWKARDAAKDAFMKAYDERIAKEKEVKTDTNTPPAA